jgi:hypothetical protein
MEPIFRIEDYVMNLPNTDFKFEGQVRAVFRKKNGNLRYVVENADGLLHIFAERHLTRKTQ